MNKRENVTSLDEWRFRNAHVPDLSDLQGETGLDHKSARLLYIFRAGSGSLLFDSELRFCDQLEERLAAAKADRALDIAAPSARAERREAPEPEPRNRPPWTVPPFVWRDPATIPRRQFIYGRYYARGVVAATIGDGGIGKSILKKTELLAAASGRALLGIEPHERVRVLYWNGDDPATEVERRIHAICQHHKIDLKQLVEEGWLYIGTRDKQPLIIGETTGRGLVIHEKTVAEIEAFIREHNIGLAAFDPFKAVHRVSENDNTAIDAIADQFNLIAERTNAAIALDHHVRKPAFGQGETTTADARGASAMINKVRLSRVLNVMTPQQAIAARIKEDERRSYFRADTGKANIAPPGKAAWFRIFSVACPNGEDSPVVVPWKYPNAFDSITVEHMRKVREMAAQGRYRKDSQAADWIGRALADVTELDADDEADLRQIKEVLKAWFANGVLATELRKDEKRRTRAYVVPGNWNEGKADTGAPP